MLPHSDPSGILTAVISAALFAVALVYLLRSRRGTEDLETSLTSIFASNTFSTGRVLFSTAFVDRPLPCGGLLASLAMHALVLGGLPLTPYIFPLKLHPDLGRYNVKIVEFRLPGPVFYPSPEQKPSQRLAALQTKATPRLAMGRKAQPALTEAAEVAGARKRPQFQLPESWRGRNRNVVIQPDQPPDLSMVVHSPLPTAFLWAQAPTPLEMSRLVGAPLARRAPLPAFALPHAIPALQKPNRELSVADLEIAAAPVLTFRPPRLPVPVANVSPVSIPAPGFGEMPASALPFGNPLNLIALMNTPAPASAGYLLDVGNLTSEAQSSAPAGAQNGGGTGASSADAASGASSGTSNSSVASKGTYADLLSSAAGGAEIGSPAATGARADRARPAVPTGNLGVIVVQESAQDSVLEGAEALTGQPVYTVYFEVPGAPRRWVLQYCVPGAVLQPSIQNGDGVIHIVPRRSVRPPYPLERIPVDVSNFQGDLRRLVVYATINEQGEPGNLRLVQGTGQPIDQAAVAILSRWKFQPATRGEVPVAVEALFGIPLQ